MLHDRKGLEVKHKVFHAVVIQAGGLKITNTEGEQDTEEGLLQSKERDQ